MTVQEIQDYKDGVRYLMRVYLIANMSTCSEFAQEAGLHHVTTIRFFKDTSTTRIDQVNKIEEYLRTKLSNADALMKEGIQERDKAMTR